MKSNLLSQLDCLIARHVKCALILKLSATMSISPVSEMQGSSFRLITRNWCSSAELLVRCPQEVYAISLVQTYRDITGIFQLARLYVIFCQKITLSLCQKYEKIFDSEAPQPCYSLLQHAVEQVGQHCCPSYRSTRHLSPALAVPCCGGKAARWESIIPSGEKERERWHHLPHPLAC